MSEPTPTRAEIIYHAALALLKERDALHARLLSVEAERDAWRTYATELEIVIDGEARFQGAPADVMLAARQADRARLNLPPIPTPAANRAEPGRPATIAASLDPDETSERSTPEHSDTIATVLAPFDPDEAR